MVFLASHASRQSHDNRKTRRNCCSNLGLIQKAEVIPLLNSLVEALDAYINGPNEANLKGITNQLDTLRARLSADEWRLIPRTWLLYLEEIGFTRYLGINLVTRLSQVLSFADMTSAQAKDEVTRIRLEIEQYVRAFNQIVAASQTLKVQKETLEPGAGGTWGAAPAVPV